MIIGKRISGRYKILDMIGGGGMANVYLAHDMILDRDVAVKMLRLDFANDEEFIRRFHREAQSATSLTHPNIVSIYDVGEEDGLYYIVMEYVDGQTLKQYIHQNAPLSVEETIDIMNQLTSAISHAHHNHIVHRDIKPHNILIDGNGIVKVTDFGIAMALSATSITQTNSVLGSVHYLSPEQARGGMANKKSDIYSLGIVMFELLTGRLPFSGESAVSIALKHLQTETPSIKRWNPNIPQSVENIVLKATAKDPFHRYDDVYQMEEDLRSALDPDRLDEPKFAIPVDDDATKAIPVITDDRTSKNLDQTLIHGRDNGQTSGKPYDKKPDKKKKRKKWPFILVFVFALMAILGTLLVTIGPDLLGPKEIKVPDVAGEELADAVEQLTLAGFQIGEKERISHEEIPEGDVIRTSPNAGRMANEGSEIKLYISSGKERVTLSNYVDGNFEDVERRLKEQGFNSVTANEVFDDSEAGTILEQDPEAGEEVVPGETDMEFTVSKGPEMVELENLTGFNYISAEGYVKANGLKLKVVGEKFHDTIDKEHVLTQDPQPGTKVAKNSTVSVVLSKGKQANPKTVTRDIGIPYDATKNGLPQTVQIYIQDMNRNINVPDQTFEITQTEKRVLEFRIAPGGTGAYKVMVDGQVTDEDEIEYPEE
ncbi:Stk1 family PASTA domain-containing Ser/Thr kinase [Bacillus sp. T33-2]|uniref:Stk1 family PASTA domain-containing Ser/Thr kinase n=1 Tax=Bacillus sp. T33-2 TaxID=2054168 RepID=UPI000C7759AC|nr:Stk1 family PASTA domain-containing Ser/Thr kinase [Bacillus sp. T33-2]PLR97329.1 serine/threonine protein kinase [Bacillus sp. T33-2]